jgi:hypothetical protein
MKLFRNSIALVFSLSIALSPVVAQLISPEDVRRLPLVNSGTGEPVATQTITAADAKNHIGEQATVCGLVAGKHVASRSQGKPTFVDLEKPRPNQTMTVLIWERDKAKVGTLPASGQVCVTGPIVQDHGGAEIALHYAASWFVPKAQPEPPQLSNDHHYTNSDGQQVHSPAYSSGGAPAGATAQCADGTYSFSTHRSGTCSHHGGVSKWL